MAAPRGDRRTKAPNVHGKPDVSYPDSDYTKPTVTERRTVRQTATAPTAFLTAHPDTTKYPTAKKTKDLSEIGDNHDVNQVEVFETLPGALLSSTRLGEHGVTETVTRQRVAAGSVSVAGGYLVTGDQIIADSKVVSVQTRSTVPSWPILTEYDQDPEMLSLITRTYQIVDATAVSAPSAVTGTVTEYRHMDKWRSLKVETTYSTPASYSEQRFMAYTFETMLRDYNWTEECGTFINAEWGKSLMVEARLAISFGTRKTIGKSTSDFPALRVWTNTFRQGGFSISDVLNDADIITYTGTCVGCVEIPASSPSATAYAAYFNNTEQLVSGESVLWKAGIYKTSVLYIMFPTKPSVTSGDCTP